MEAVMHHLSVEQFLKMVLLHCKLVQVWHSRAAPTKNDKKGVKKKVNIEVKNKDPEQIDNATTFIGMGIKSNNSLAKKKKTIN